MAKQYFHFTLGPVQGFVAQARRTRDFWAGSFLLSWLSGVAMAEIRRQGGEIDFPSPAEGYLDWIITGNGPTEAPRQGGVPNRFKAVSARVPENFDGKLLAATVRAAWCTLAEHVWTGDQLDAIALPVTREIWHRQHTGFWEISWIQTADENASSLLDQRKNWRNHFPAAEAGVKCMIMDGWQELSGAERPADKPLSAPHGFWYALRASGVAGITADLAEGEHLCALAYVKRRFARHFESFETTLPSSLQLAGWRLDSGVPSVSYIAAVHWLEALLATGTPEQIWRIKDSAQAVNPSRDEWDTRIRCLVQAAERWHASNDKRQLLSLDGNLFFEHVRDNPNVYGYEAEAVRELSQELKNFHNSHPDFNAPLSPFYAVLLMDGDSLGAHMSQQVNQQPISQALEQFTSGVPEIVENHNGFLIYAGGDDVLAILPLEDALDCAAAVRRHYLASFKASAIPTTISAAIEYAHVKMPLGKVLHDAHDLLDHVAKDGAGRDAVAARVWKPGGIALEWAQPWVIALAGEELVLNQIVRDFIRQSGDEDVQLSNKFFHRIGEHFNFLNPARLPDGEWDQAVLNENQAADLLAVDFFSSGSNREAISLEEARARILPLLKQCRPVVRSPGKPEPEWFRSPCLKPDGALLVRFLAQKGVDQ